MTDYSTLLDVIVSFVYYDGPEYGLALYGAGPTVCFKSFGDSSSRLFRAFEIFKLEGDWWSEANKLPEIAAKKAGSGPVVVANKSSKELMILISEVESAVPSASFIGVGSASMEWLKVSRVSDSELSALRDRTDWLDRYRAAHAFIKRSSSVGPLRSILETEP